MFYKKILSFEEILDANKNKDNLAEKLESSDRGALALKVVERAEKDKKSMAEWLRKGEIGMQLLDLKYVPKGKPYGDAESYNIQYPVLLNGVNSTSARLFTEIHKDKYISHPTIIGDDPEHTKAVRKKNVKHYINYVTIDCPYSNWLHNQRKMYSKLVLLGTQIKQIKFDAFNNTFDSDFIPYTDIYIHNKTSSLEAAPAITKCVYLSQNDIVERVNRGFFIKSDATSIYDSNGNMRDSSSTEMNYDDGTEALWDKTYKIYEQHMWADLDGDGYAEPYIAFVNAEASTLLRLTPRIEEYASELRVENEVDVKPTKLVAECFFADYHYKPSPLGDFWSMGLAHEIGPMNQVVNESMNILMNTATLATKQGGLVAGGMRGATGRFKTDMTKYQTVPGVTGEMLRNSIVDFNIKDPSPVLLQLTNQFIETAEKIASLNEALSGEMPSRELPVGTMLLIVEQSLKNAQYVYMNIHAGLTKELQIMARTLVQYGDPGHYQRVTNDPTADLVQDFDLKSIDFTINSDSSMSSDAERLIKLQVLKDIVSEPITNPYINAEEYYLRIFDQLDIPDSRKLLQKPPPPQEDPLVGVAKQQQALDAVELDQKYTIEVAKHSLDEIDTIASAELKRAQAVAALMGATSDAKAAEAALYQESAATTENNSVDEAQEMAMKPETMQTIVGILGNVPNNNTGNIPS